ncbi:hypothetical protein LXL04_035754 [Taraxacum kok-saghyz]
MLALYDSVVVYSKSGSARLVKMFFSTPKRLHWFLKSPDDISSAPDTDLVSLWEKKIGKNLERDYISDDQVLKNIQESSVMMNVFLSISHSIFVKGDQTNFEIKPSFGVEASALYSVVQYTTVDDSLKPFV